MILRISTALLALWATSAAAVECENTEFDGKNYSVCTVDMQTENLRLFLNRDNGARYGTFSALPGTVTFAMNAGMYHEDRSPVGHYVENGVEIMRVIPNAGPGNFGLLPNGILCITPDRVQVIETLRFQATAPECTHATQSGPMLVIDGQLHPKFIPNSPYTNIRNGVGTSDNGRFAHFVISNEQVSFDHMARLFRDHFNVKQALYLDGRVSRLYAPSLGRADFGARMGPIVAVTD